MDKKIIVSFQMFMRGCSNFEMNGCTISKGHWDIAFGLGPQKT
jgi:hypothetical protein